MKRYILYAHLFSILLFASCEKEETAIAKYNRGDVIEQQVALGEDYNNQVWFDLGTNKTVSTNLKTDWDIAFDCNDNSDWVYLNSSRLMQAAVIEDGISFDSVNSITGLVFKADHVERNNDSLAIGENTAGGKIYVIDMGYNSAGDQLGYSKIQFISVTGSAYSFRCANLNGSNNYTATVAKNNTYNAVAFSFSKKETVMIEPAKTDYDICFTQYTYFFYNPYQPYLVTGVLINRSGVSVAGDSTKNFNDINSADTSNYSFSNSLDVIGYDWKEYSFSSGVYSVFSQKNFIIKDDEGFYYKLHFIDFYNATGSKGYPTFEYQKL